MRVRRNREDSSELINLTSLIDVMFILIIFFLATTTFQREEHDLKVNLPESAEGKTLSEAPRVMVINVREDGQYYLAGRTMALAEMNTEIRETLKKAPDQKVLIRGDQRALHGHVAAAVALCKQAGVHEANIGYQLPPR